MVQFLSIYFFLFFQFLLGFSKVLIFLCHPVFALWNFYVIIKLSTMRTGEYVVVRGEEGGETERDSE